MGLTWGGLSSAVLIGGGVLINPLPQAHCNEPIDILTSPGLGRACPELWKIDITTGTKPPGEWDYAQNPHFLSPYLPRSSRAAHRSQAAAFRH